MSDLTPEQGFLLLVHGVISGFLIGFYLRRIVTKVKGWLNP